MRVKNIFLPTVLSLFLSGVQASEQAEMEGDSLDTFKKIQAQSSQVPEMLSVLSDVYGPRLSGTPRYREAVEWTEKQLKSWGVDKVEIQRINGALRGWEVESFSASMTEPAFLQLNAQPLCCSASTNGDVEGVPILIDFYDMDALKRLSGKLKGKILLQPELPESDPRPSGRWPDSRLEKAAARLDPVAEDGLDGPGSESTFVDEYPEMQEEKKAALELTEFLIREGVGAVMASSDRGYGVLNSHLDLSSFRLVGQKDPEPVPFILLSKEQHGRMLRMMDKGVEPKINLSLKTRYFDNPDYFVNVIAEIEGSDPKLKDEVVFIGAHFDSVELGTGASDNGVGVAIGMEILRMIKQSGLKPRRTIRLGLWGAEEMGLLGSLSYVQENIGNIFTGEFAEERDNIVAYFNHDNNGHDIRGIYLLGREEIRPTFNEIIKPLKPLGAGTVTIENACCTDLVVFDGADIPSFEWIQDPMHYFSHQLHTDLDVPELLDDDVITRNAVIIAHFVYETAMRDQRLMAAPEKR